ncbi:hypothetical protein BHU72_14160 [Desulfuribacillus stibiiarsenatis]|uniref:C4-dicarboxylate ABC transporter n=1 Tax=Desulfuribacillus stibiiarsenatis TaxID=1390249 RepID=A0A1E5L8J5_9FIRM|nr:hypothetical protein BHU72_14160 [Desulfuribacillus stibiiarsenatis]
MSSVLILVCIVLLAGCSIPPNPGNLFSGKKVVGVDFEQVGPEDKIVIKFSHVVAENTPKGLAANKFKRLAESKTNGRVEVQIFPNAQLYDDDAAIAALQQNQVQMIAPATSKMTYLIPEWQVFDLPYAFRDEEAVKQAMEGELGLKLFSLLEPHGLIGLTMWDNGFKQLTTKKRPIHKLNDIQGLSFRIMDSNILKKQFELFGATPVVTRFSDVYSFLEQDMTDGQENTLSNIYTKRFYEVQDYLTVSDHGYLGYAVITNQEFWNAIPDDIQILLEEAMKETTQWIRVNAKRINEEQLENLTRTQRLRVHYLTATDKAEWKKLLSPVYQQLTSEIGNEYMRFLPK